MDLKGFEAINRALVSAEVDATVTPQPGDDENVRYLTVETESGVQPARVLNALHAAGLMQRAGSSDAVARRTPELSPLGVQQGSLTFEDKNGGNRRMWG